MYDLGNAVAELWRAAIGVGVDQYLFVFATAFAAAWLVGKTSPPLLNRYFIAENATVRFLKKRSLFYVEDAPREEAWLNLLRVVVGGMYLSRSFGIFYYQLALDGAPSHTLISLLDVIASLCVMIGLLTPVALGFLFLFHTYAHDALLGTFTLGSCVAQILTLILLFLPAGRRLSLDGLVLRTGSIGAGALTKIYGFVGIPTTNRIAIVKFCAFISYGLLCMYSVYEHLRDPYWLNGTANVLLLSSNWLVAPYQFFRDVFTVYGAPAIVVSMIALYVMMAWELLIIPFTLIKGITRHFVIFWGLAFFVVSVFILQLSWLPHFQFVLFGMLFWPGWLLNRGDRKSLQLFYDDHCNLCDRTVRFLSCVDWFDVVRLRPMSQSGEEIAACGLTREQVFDDLHGYDPTTGSIYKGYALYTRLSARIAPLAPLYPLLLLGSYLKAGPAIYRFVARRRRRIFGICRIPTVDLTHAMHRETVVPVVTEKNLFMIAFLASYVIFSAVYLIRFPYFSHIPGWSVVQRQIGFASSGPPMLNGQIPIIVFSPNVMTMGSHYFTITGVYENEEKLLPYVGPEGDRMALVNGSDRLYFGHALGWRRLMYDRYSERICYDRARDDEFLFGLFRLAERHWGSQPEHFRVDYYHQPIPDPEAAARLEYKMGAREHVCSVIARPQRQWVVSRSDGPAAIE